jgi:hypothetical protein
MKTLRVLLALFSTMAASIASAQTIDIVVLDRSVNYTQTVAGSSTLDGATPYSADVFINGSNLNLLSSMSFKKPGDAVTVYAGQLNGSEWEAPTSGNAFDTMANLHAAFGAGAYTISVSGFSDSSLTMTNLVGSTNDGLPNMPFVIATQDSLPVTWSGGKMLVDPTLALTINTTTFSTNFTNGLGRVGVGVFGDIPDQEANNDTGGFVFNGNSVQLVIAANTFTAGQNYSGDMEFNHIIGSLVDLSGIYGGSAQGIVIYSAFTSFQIQAIPEPTTYAAIFGALACLGVAFKRRRALVGAMVHRRRKAV